MPSFLEADMCDACDVCDTDAADQLFFRRWGRLWHLILTQATGSAVDMATLIPELIELKPLDWFIHPYAQVNRTTLQEAPKSVQRLGSFAVLQTTFRIYYPSVPLEAINRIYYLKYTTLVRQLTKRLRAVAIPVNVLCNLFEDLT